MKPATRRAAVVGLCAVLLVCAATESRGFREDFNGTSLNPAVWQVELGNGEVVVADGVVTVSCAGSTFPVATTIADPIPDGDFVVRVRMRYPTVTTCGDGFGALDNFYPFSPLGCRPFLVWQDGGGWYAYSGSTAQFYIGTGPETGYHTYEWRYMSGVYEFSLDGVSLYADSCAPRATALFFGHPHPVSCPSWTSFEIDFIEVVPFGPTSASQNSWGRLKQIYR